MGLSRLDNFLKSVRGTIIYVDPNSLDSTDSIENTGNSLTRPFKTIQRALIEAARFSYQRGQKNDRFGKTSILLYPGDHFIDNRPGYIPTGNGLFSKRSGQTGVSDLTQWDLSSNFDLTTPNNELYKLNSVYGGVIVPRGTSIVGLDLRKTKIRPLYVPDPRNNNIERSCIFRTTGACYFWQFTILDADPNGNCYKNYNPDLFVPNFSHHKLSGFEYADGINGVYINDAFLNQNLGTGIDTSRTDLDMYYEKVGIVYGASSGREIPNDYDGGTTTVDIQPIIDEYRIVGPKGASVGITSIRSGNGTVSSSTITVDLVESIEGLSVDSPIEISGVNASGYDGQYVIASVPTDTQITYRVQNPPSDPLPGVTGSTLSLVVDTVTSASPYIFNISLRSVYGMCGLLADGDKATGFKSMVVAQYTGIGLQKDDQAFVKYDSVSGTYQQFPSVLNLSTDSRSRFKPEYENFHIKATNDAFLQLVSVFAIGYAQHFVTENGGDIALNNSNSNFGAKALVSSGFKKDAFSQDDYGYITHIIPPKEINPEEISVEFNLIDVGITTQISAGSATTSRLYLYNETNEDSPPRVVIDGYNVGAKQNEQINIQVVKSGIVSTYSSRVVMPDGPYRSTQSSSEKSFTVARSVEGINSINSNVFTLTEAHSLINGESIRIISDNGNLPDGLQPNQIYYASTVGITTNNQIYVSKTLNDAINGNSITINNKGGVLKVVSKVSDKNAGDIGHPVQWDTFGYWYIGVSTSNNGIYNAIKSFGTSGLGKATSRSYVTRKSDSRSLIDTLYRVRYVLSKDAPSSARPPVDGFILQESNNIIGSGSAEISQIYNTSGSISSIELRNPKFIANASWSSNLVTIRSELPHNLRIGDQVEIVNVSPTEYNGIYTVTSLPSAKEFTYQLTVNPGTFGSDTSNRNEDLPYFKRKKYTKTYQVYRTQEIQSFIKGVQDGVYYLTLINHSNSPTVTPFSDQSFAQPVENLYPQSNNDNPNSNPEASVSHAIPNPIGKVVINDPQKSVTRETLESFVVGYGITNIRSSSGTAHTIYTSIDHGFSGITSVSIVSGGSAYGSGSPGILYNAQLVGYAGSTTGSNATAKITLGSGGVISGVTIIDGGSAYGIGNTLRVVGVATTSGFVQGVVRVQAVSSNVGDTIEVSGVSSDSYSGYNTLYRISEIEIGKPKEINVVSAETLQTYSTSGLGLTFTSNAGYILTGKVLQINSFNYSSTTGIATVQFASSHGFKVDNKVSIRGANQSVFNGDFIVEQLINNTQLTLKIGIQTSSTSATGTLYAYRPGLTSYGGDLSKDRENISGRLSYQYAGITTTLGSIYSLTATGALNIPNAVSLGFTLGDYLLIDYEIFRIKQAVTSNSVFVHRAVLGSPVQEHQSGSVVRRIKVVPVELRRNSIIRASGHTFEYLGFGPGNYSTSLPEKQDRALSNTEKFLAQATKLDGGIVVYTGMNSDGDFFAGNKKINSATGKEETFDTPVPSNTGEKETPEIVNITDTQKLFVESSIKVEGGKDKNVVSEFDGPVVFNNKVTSNSEIEASTLLVQGEDQISRGISISRTKPTIVGNYGDIKFNANPEGGRNSGWIYTTENEWKEFGLITSGTQDLYGVGISTGSGPVGFSTLLNVVAIGITLGRSYDSTTGITTLTFTGASPLGNTIGIYTGSPTSSVFAGNANAIKFIGSQDGFGVNFIANYDPISGFTTVTIQSPLDPINFSSSLPRTSPTFTTRSPGTRLVYFDQLTSTTTDFAVGVEANASWSSVPRNINDFKWYAGTTGIATLSGTGNLSLSGGLTASGNITLTGGITATGGVTGSTLSATTTTGQPISVGSSTQVNNLNSQYLNGFEGTWYTDIPARLGYTPFNVTGDSVSGLSNFSGGLNVSGGITTALNVTGNARISETLRPNAIADKDDQVGSSGQVLTSTGSQLDWKNLSDLPLSGRILQVVRTTQSTAVQHTPAWEDTGLTATITPSSVNSKIIIIINQPVVGNADRSGGIRIMRGTTVLYNPGQSCFGTGTSDGTSSTSLIASLQYIDDPASTSAVTYKTQGYGNDSQFYSNQGQNARILQSATSQIYLIEIS
jgi:hypothetical protein